MADKNEKTLHQSTTMSDKEFYIKLVLSLMCIIGCAGMMVSSALAFFVSNAQSTGNVIRAGNFEVEVYAECGCAGGCSFTTCTAEQDMHSYNIVPNGTAKGYAKIILDNGVERKEQYTEQLTSPITITVQAMSGTNVIVKSFWGDVNNNVVSRNGLISDGEFIFHSISPPPEEEEFEGEEDSENSTDADTDLTEQPVDAEVNSAPVEPDTESGGEDNSIQSEPIVEEQEPENNISDEPENSPEDNDGGEAVE